MRGVRRFGIVIATAVVIVCGTTLAPVTPARAAPPNVITVTGSAPMDWSMYTADFAIRPWKLFGNTLTIATVSGTLIGRGPSGTMSTAQCALGLAWDVTYSSAPDTVSFTCLQLLIQKDPINGFNWPYLGMWSITAVNGPGGSITERGATYPESDSDPIHVTFY